MNFLHQNLAVLNELQQANDDLREKQRSERIAVTREEEGRIQKELKEKEKHFQEEVEQNQQLMNSLARDFEVRDHHMSYVMEYTLNKLTVHCHHN